MRPDGSSPSGLPSGAGLAGAFSPEMRADPYPLYKQLRASDPVLWWDDPGIWLITGYEEAVSVLHHPNASTDHRAAQVNVSEAGLGPSERGLENVMLFMDPPDHTRLRTLVNKAFTPRAIDRMRTRIQQIADELLEARRDSKALDVIADFAYPLPVRVIAEMLGVPQEDLPRFREWSRAIAPILDPVMSMESLEGIADASLALSSYFDEMIAMRRKEPRDDLLTALVQSEERGHRLTEEELRATCVLLLIAGHETTMNLIGNGLLALLHHPDQLRRLRDDPSLMRDAIEELLRYEGPVHLTARTARGDIAVNGKTVREGEMSIVLLGAANRDPDQFPDPDDLDVGRHPNRHIAFSAGGHFCLGAPLARIEGHIALETLLRRAPGIELTAEPEWRDTITLRGLKSLPVSL